MISRRPFLQMTVPFLSVIRGRVNRLVSPGLLSPHFLDPDPSHLNLDVAASFRLSIPRHLGCSPGCHFNPGFTRNPDASPSFPYFEMQTETPPPPTGLPVSGVSLPFSPTCADSTYYLVINTPRSSWIASLSSYEATTR